MREESMSEFVASTLLIK